MILLWTGLACAPEAPDVAVVDTDGPTVVVQPELTSATYHLTWAVPEDVVREEGAWVFETDLGFIVTLESGALVSYSTWLTACPETTRWLPDPLDLVFGAPAYAGHSVLSNATSSFEPVVEDLLAPETQVLETVTFEPGHYCEVSQLLARGDLYTHPDGHDMDGTSLRLVGTWRRGTGPETAFVVDTPIAHSGGVALSLTGSGPHVDVIVERRLDGLFDGIDFETTPEARIARDVLANLVDGMHFAGSRTAVP